MQTWPPAYQIKKHAQAKSIKLKIIYGKGLHIVTPRHVHQREIDFALEQHKSWILKKLSEFCIPVTDLPQEIHLLALNEKWHVHYLSCNGPFEMFEKPGFEIVLLGNVNNRDFCIKKLVDWMKRKAKIFLSSHLKMLAEFHGLTFHKMIIRDQYSRWGSCNEKKTISLNYKLMFLPYYLCSHVMLHELCHTRYLNHSRQFWGLLEQFDPIYHQHKKELNHAQRFIPAWL